MRSKTPTSIKSARSGPSQPALHLCLEQLRAFWIRRQGLGGPVKGGVAGAVRASGWMNSAGGTGPYIAIRARLPGCGRGEVDRAVFQEGSVIEVHAVRGCAMLVPTEDVPLALYCARRSDRERFDKLRRSCGVTENELRELADAIVAVLERGSLTPDAMRECLPPQLYRSLGEEGKRLGESSTLTAALRQLLKQGEIQRFPIDQRLDTNRYAYKLFVPNPHAAFPLPENEDDVQRELARHFFRWAGPATIKEFAWWAGMSQKEAKRAMHPLALAQASISEWSEEAWVVEEDMNALRATPDLEHKTLNLIPVRDNYLSFRRGMSVFASLEDRNTQILDWRNRLAPVAGLESIHNHTIIARGLLAGLWEYDADRGKIVWTAIGSLSASQRRAIHDQIEGLEAFIREELGDVQFYALDRGRQRQERIKAIRCM